MVSMAGCCAATVARPPPVARVTSQYYLGQEMLSDFNIGSCTQRTLA